MRHLFSTSYLLTLDIDVRFCEKLSTFTEHPDLELFGRIKYSFIESITTQFVKLLKTSGTTVIFKIDDCEENCVEVDWEMINRHLITDTHTHHFDFVSALTQGGINEHFKSLWEVAKKRVNAKKEFKTWSSAEFEEEVCLADYSFVNPDHGEKAFFASSFASPEVQLQLRCKDGTYSVIFYVHLMEGYLKTLGPGKSLQPELVQNNYLTHSSR